MHTSTPYIVTNIEDIKRPAGSTPIYGTTGITATFSDYGAGPMMTSSYEHKGVVGHQYHASSSYRRYTLQGPNGQSFQKDEGFYGIPTEWHLQRNDTINIESLDKADRLLEHYMYNGKELFCLYYSGKVHNRYSPIPMYQSYKKGHFGREFVPIQTITEKNLDDIIRYETYVEERSFSFTSKDILNELQRHKKKYIMLDIVVIFFMISIFTPVTFLAAISLTLLIELFNYLFEWSLLARRIFFRTKIEKNMYKQDFEKMSAFVHEERQKRNEQHVHLSDIAAYFRGPKSKNLDYLYHVEDPGFATWLTSHTTLDAHSIQLFIQHSKNF